jgi:PIN domain nuclease of toxin-antitoxin system
MTPVLDTHAWIWWVDRDRRLGAAIIDALDRLPADMRPVLCEASLAEVAALVGCGRLKFDMPFAEWLAAAAHPRTVRLQPMTSEIAVELAGLPGTFAGDIVDRVVVATARSLGLPLVTHDRRITSARLARKWSLRGI